jgi:predicted Zn-dependent protease with MMP-like domain
MYPLLTDDQCKAVREALGALPPEFGEKLRDVAIVIEDSDPDGVMGVYDPVGGHHFGLDEQKLGELGYG